MNIYAPNREDPQFFHQVNKILGEMEGQIVLAGDFNEVMDPCLDRSIYKGPLSTKSRSAVHMLKDDAGLIDAWRLINPSKREYTFFSHCHKSYSRIDLFLVSNSLINCVMSCSIKSIALTDHAGIELCVRLGVEQRKGSRWRMNVSLLQDKSFKKLLGEDLKNFFDLNIGSTQCIESVWEASKAYIRGKIIAYGAKKKKEGLQKIKELETEIKLKENKLSEKYDESLYRDTCGLKFQLNEIYDRKVSYSLFRLKTTFYEGGEKTGKVLARQVKKNRIF